MEFKPFKCFVSYTVYIYIYIYDNALKLQITNEGINGLSCT